MVNYMHLHKAIEHVYIYIDLHNDTWQYSNLGTSMEGYQDLSLSTCRYRVLPGTTQCYRGKSVATEAY